MFKSNKTTLVVVASLALSFITIYLAFNATEWWHGAVPVAIAIAFGVILGRGRQS